MVPAGTEGKHLSVSLYTHGQNMIPNSIGGYYKVIEDSNSAALSNDKADLTIPTDNAGTAALRQTRLCYRLDEQRSGHYFRHGRCHTAAGNGNRNAYRDAHL